MVAFITRARIWLLERQRRRILGAIGREMSGITTPENELLSLDDLKLIHSDRCQDLMEQYQKASQRLGDLRDAMKKHPKG